MIRIPDAGCLGALAMAGTFPPGSRLGQPYGNGSLGRRISDPREKVTDVRLRDLDSAAVYAQVPAVNTT